MKWIVHNSIENLVIIHSKKPMWDEYNIKNDHEYSETTDAERTN